MQTQLQQLFNICNNLFGRKQDLPLLACESNQELADSVKNFVIHKISILIKPLILLILCVSDFSRYRTVK